MNTLLLSFSILFLVCPLLSLSVWESWSMTWHEDLHTTYFTVSEEDIVKWEGLLDFSLPGYVQSYSDQIVFYHESKALANTFQIPDAIVNNPNYHFESFDKLYRVDPDLNVILGRSAQNSPYIRWVGTNPINVTANFVSPEVLIGTSAPFNLSNGAEESIVAFGPIIKEEQEYSIDFLIDNPIPSSDSQLLLDTLRVLFSRALILSEKSKEAIDIKLSNEDRRYNSRVAVAFVWLFIWIGMVSLVMISAVLQTWIRPYCYVGEKKSLLWWFFGVLLIVQIISWFGGLAGWFICMLFFLIYIITGAIIYYHSKCKKDGALIHNVHSFNEESLISTDPYSTDFVSMPTIPMGKVQRPFIKWSGLIWIFCFIILLILISDVMWEVRDYKVMDRDEGRAIVEFQPQLIAKTIALMYNFDGMMSFLHIEWFLDIQTDYCGSAYTEPLDDDEKKSSIYENFILKYEIDMKIYQRTSVNDWFTRKLADNIRPIAWASDNSVVVSPADARITVFPVVPKDLKVWLKGEEFTVTELLDDSNSALVDGSMAIVRLSPQDYHRFHAPVSGTITSQKTVEGPLYSVNADAMRSENGAIYNQRMITFMNASGLGQMAFVAIGATCVGSVQMISDSGAFTKGDEFGFFQFGGSTVVLLFPQNTIEFEEDLLSYSEHGVETLVKMGTKIAQVV